MEGSREPPEHPRGRHLTRHVVAGPLRRLFVLKGVGRFTSFGASDSDDGRTGQRLNGNGGSCFMRERQGFALLLRACATGMAVASWSVPAAVAQPDVGTKRSPTREKGARGHVDDRVDSQLAAIVAARAHGAQAALRIARTNGLEIVQGQNQSGRRSLVGRRPHSRGGTRWPRRGDRRQPHRSAPTGRLDRRRLHCQRGRARACAVSRLRIGHHRQPGRRVTAAEAWQAAGTDRGEGRGHRLGFAGLARSQSEGELPAGLSASTTAAARRRLEAHGTAVAEIVHEMAPGAELHLICVDTLVGLARAAAYARTTGSRSSTTRPAGSTPVAATAAAPGHA